jgi:hypothetical protein
LEKPITKTLGLRFGIGWAISVQMRMMMESRRMGMASHEACILGKSLPQARRGSCALEMYAGSK